MRTILNSCCRISIWLLLAGLSACSTTREHGDRDLGQITSQALRRFRSMAEFEAYMERLELLSATGPHNQRILLAQNAPNACSPPLEDCGELGAKSSSQLQEVVLTAQRRSSTITNTQEADVDEGDIVKQFGGYLIVLQDGRLFSVDTGDAAGPLRLVDRINIYTSGEDDTWYDELLIYQNKLVVTGYNYRQDASEINVFTIDEHGVFSFDVRYFIESEDYYSGENYASRLVHGKFIFYTPLELERGLEIPRIRSWTPTSGFSSWQPLFAITDVYRPIQETLSPTLHVVSVCQIGSGKEFGCMSRGVVGPAHREFYVSSSNIYLWLTSDRQEWDRAYRRRHTCREQADLYSYTPVTSAVFQLRVDSQQVRAAHTIGSPRDQFAFDERQNELYALLTRVPLECYLDGQLPMMLADIPLGSLSTWPQSVPAHAYQRTPVAEGYDLQTRYSQRHVVYGSPHVYWRGDQADYSGGFTVVPLRASQHAEVLRLPHTIERIELIGQHAVAVGLHGAEDLGISTVRLDAAPQVTHSIVLPGVEESEGRSHAFNARVEDDGSGLWGLPTVFREKRSWDAPSDVQFFATDRDLHITSMGELAGQSDDDEEYECEASCEDWYGNARPIFIGERVFALTGNEIIEGHLEWNRIIEIGRFRLTGAPDFQR